MRADSFGWSQGWGVVGLSIGPHPRIDPDGRGIEDQVEVYPPLPRRLFGSVERLLDHLLPDLGDERVNVHRLAGDVLARGSGINLRVPLVDVGFDLWAHEVFLEPLGHLGIDHQRLAANADLDPRIVRRGRDVDQLSIAVRGWE
jgi:hypothetical protein